MFTNCTKKYKAEYNEDVIDNPDADSVLSMTCKLIDKLVVVCGDEWLECHGEEEVRRMKEMQVEYLIVRNRGAEQVDIEQCPTVQQFRLSYYIPHKKCPCSYNFVCLINKLIDKTIKRKLF